jgi:hypothetical protein
VLTLVFWVGHRFNNFHSPAFINFMTLTFAAVGALAILSHCVSLVDRRLSAIGFTTVIVSIAIPILAS